MASEETKRLSQPGMLGELQAGYHNMIGWERAGERVQQAIRIGKFTKQSIYILNFDVR